MSKGMYTITEARQGRTYTSQYGDMVVWHVKLGNAQAETPDGSFELHKKPGNTPAAGNTIEVERTQQGVAPDGSAFVRIYLAKPAQQAGSGAQGASGGQRPQGEGPGITWRSQPYERGAEHPRNEARAIHTSAISAAPEYYKLAREELLIEKPQTKAEWLNVMAGIVTWLEAGYGPVLDAVQAPASQNGNPAQPPLTPPPESGVPLEVPADMEGLAPTPTQQAAQGGDDLGF